LTETSQKNQRYALISVTDKGRVALLAKGLVDAGYTILSTGNTAKVLREKGVAVTDIVSYTGSPELLDGRVKTLHPKIHAGILADRSNSSHVDEMHAQAFPFIDVVVCNLYAFEKTVASGCSVAEAIEHIDIGGVTLLRAAAKNFAHVAVVCDPQDYDGLLEELQKQKSISLGTRRLLAAKAFQHTASYDAAIDMYLSKTLRGKERLHLVYTDGVKLRYGENWHQEGFFYKDNSVSEPTVGAGKQLHGKQLSFNNYIDMDAALGVAKDLKASVAAVVVKHTNPCGIATGKTMKDALKHAWDGDRVSAFGSVIAVTRVMDLDAAQFLKGKFVEIVIAPGFTDEAKAYLMKKSKDLRLIDVGDIASAASQTFVFKPVIGGMLKQTRPVGIKEKWECVTKASFPDSFNKLGEFTITATKHTKSNATILAIEYEPGFYKVLGMGAGQPNRVDSFKKLCLTKAKENLEHWYEELADPGMNKDAFVKQKLSESVMGSDAFFPFDDTVRAAAEHNVNFIIQPGGSKRDQEVIEACDELGVAMIFTGMRYFNH